MRSRQARHKWQLTLEMVSKRFLRPRRTNTVVLHQHSTFMTCPYKRSRQSQPAVWIRRPVRPVVACWAAQHVRWALQSFPACCLTRKHQSSPSTLYWWCCIHRGEFRRQICFSQREYWRRLGRRDHEALSCFSWPSCAASDVGDRLQQVA